MQRLYFDNAATSSPKPPGVMRAMVDYATRLGGSPGRGAYHEARDTGRLINECRRRINTLIGGESPDHVVFTHNCTDALNLAIKGLLVPELARDHRSTVHVVTTVLDHNSVLRPLNALAAAWPGRVLATRLTPDPRSGLINPDDLRRAVRSRPDTRLVAVNHVSNVSGVIQPIVDLGRVCRDLGVPFLVDAAQSLGHVPINVRDARIDLLAFPGHKGLLGPTGTGGLYLRPGVERRLATLREGGTGSRSELDTQPDFLPDKYEPGSPNAIGIIGLSEGVKFLLDFEHAGIRGIEAVRAHERELIDEFLAGISLSSAGAGPRDLLPGLHLLGPATAENRVGVFTLALEGMDPHAVASVLESEFGILVRAGLHCAPLAHRHFAEATPPLTPGHRSASSDDGDPSGGVRFSLGPFLRRDDVRRATAALLEVAASSRACYS